MATISVPSVDRPPRRTMVSTVTSGLFANSAMAAVAFKDDESGRGSGEASTVICFDPKNDQRYVVDL